MPELVDLNRRRLLADIQACRDDADKATTLAEIEKQLLTAAYLEEVILPLYDKDLVSISMVSGEVFYTVDDRVTELLSNPNTVIEDIT